MTFDEQLERPMRNGLLPIAAALAVGLALTGFVLGLTPVSAPRPTPARASSSSHLARAPIYADVGASRRGLNAGMYEHGLDALRAAVPASSVMPTEADRRAALEARATRRAYNGAPPTIPHEVVQQGPPDCLACHATGMVLGDKVAPRMSHARMDSCLQCHVVSHDPRPVSSRPDAPENSFVGLPAPSGGARAWRGAPPTIPHTTHLRTECSSCHGLAGPLGLRTSHPERQNCVQCHGSSALLDQRAPLPPPATP